VLPAPDTQALHAYDEVLDFLSSAPSLADIIQFQLSERARQRAQFLIEKEKAQDLTALEASELDFYIELGDFLGVLRTKAQVQLHTKHRQ
jgi:hypothetical protein